MLISAYNFTVHILHVTSAVNASHHREKQAYFGDDHLLMFSKNDRPPSNSPISHSLSLSLSLEKPGVII